VRLVHPTPRTPVIDTQRAGESDGLPVVVRHVQPSWDEDGSAVRHHDACEASPGRRVLIFGTSMSFVAAGGRARARLETPWAIDSCHGSAADSGGGAGAGDRRSGGAALCRRDRAYGSPTSALIAA
jgi:hypothetical protein